MEKKYQKLVSLPLSASPLHQCSLLGGQKGENHVTLVIECPPIPSHLVAQVIAKSNLEVSFNVCKH